MTAIQYGIYIVDDESGEVLGLADHSQEQFHADDLPGVEWVLERISEAQGDRTALTARKAAIIANLDRQIKAAESREAFMIQRFGPDLEAYAKAETEGKKQRYTDTAFGRLRFTKSPGSIRIDDPQKALVFCSLLFPDAVKTTQSVLVSALKGQEAELPADAFTVTPPRDTFKIETGVK